MNIRSWSSSKPGDSSYQLVWDFFHQQESQEIFAHKQPHPSCFKPHNLNYRYWWILMNIILFSLFGPSIAYTANVYGKRYCISQLPFCECDVPDPIFPCRERTELIGLYQEETNCCKQQATNMCVCFTQMPHTSQPILTAQSEDQIPGVRKNPLEKNIPPLQIPKIVWHWFWTW